VLSRGPLFISASSHAELQSFTKHALSTPCVCRTSAVLHPNDTLPWCIAESRRNHAGNAGRGTSRSEPASSQRRPLTDTTQCDKRKESCGQCIRAHLLCPGYHDPSRTIFNDETESVLRKAHVQPPIPASPEKLLAPCIEDRAKELFVSRYVYCKTARFPYMEHFWLARPHHAHLAVCVRAVSLAYLSVELCSPEILQRARQRYSSALRLTNTALQCLQTAKHNATLLTVLLLDLYEKLTQQLVSNSSDNSKHLDGALALLQLSGASQFDDAIRLRLFRQASMSILLRCLRRGDDIPPDLLSLRQSIDAVDQDGQLEGLMIRFVALRGGVRKGELPECEMDAEVKELDDALVQICSRPPRWKFADAIAGHVYNKELFIDLIEATTVAL
jgi:hypothetical protein